MKLPQLCVHSVTDSVVGGIKHVCRQLRDWTRPHRSTGSTLSGAFGDLSRSKPELVLENALLRHQLTILNRNVRRPKITAQDRLFTVLMARLLPGWREALLIEARHRPRLAPSAVQGLLAS